MPPLDTLAAQPVVTPKVQKPNPRNNITMFKIFQNVQHNVVQHKKYVKEMIKLYKKLDGEAFRESFKNALQYLFTFGDASPNVDRVIQFVAAFCTSLDDEEDFLLFIFEIIFECQCVMSQAVRYRASQLLAAVLAALGDEASLDDDLCDKLLASQMQRIQDARGAVRCRAALALQRLQNPMDPNDDVTKAYQFHMSCDPNPSVRRAILMSIAKCTRNVPFVLERLCDVDEAVRRAAFLYIAAVNVTQLRVKQRVLTLKVGLTERSPRVRRVVEEILIPSWLSTFQGNIIDLLKAIRLDNARDASDSRYVAGKLLESLFKRLPISELLEWLPTDKTLRVIPGDKLNKETAWYWRHLAEHLQKIEDDETLETILPDLVTLTGYIRVIVEAPCPSESDDPVAFSTRQYVLHELGSMLKVYDASDPAGRTALQSLITDVLTGDYGPLSSDVIRAFVNALELVVPDVSHRIEVISGVLTALRDVPDNDVIPSPPPPPVDSNEIKLQRARLRVSLNVAMEAQEEAVKEQNYTLAAQCKAKVKEIQDKLESLNVIATPPPPPPMSVIREKASDVATLTKCLTILNCALDTSQLKTITPMLRMIFSEFEVEIFQNPDIIELALETVALYGILDKTFANENKAFFFANLIDTSNESTVTTVLRCIVDLLCVHGARIFEDVSDTLQADTTTASVRRKKSQRNIEEGDDDGTFSESAISMSPACNTVIEILLKIMDSACAAYRLIIVEGLCRLLSLGHLESPPIISRLLLLWFNPATVDEDSLRQTIGVFFQTFPIYVDDAQEQIQKATLPTLRTLANAPASSPLAEIDQEEVVKFIVSLTRVNHELSDSQGGMAMVLCQYITRRPTVPEVGLACRMLALLSPPRDAHLASELAAMLRDLCVLLPDKQSCRHVTRYLGALEAFERASLNKMSNTGMGESTVPEDTMSIGRITTSLPQPIARSTHVIVEETVRDIEIDETSPTEVMSRISEEGAQTEPSPSESPRESSESSDIPPTKDGTQSDSSSGVSPVKKAKVSKSKKKNINQRQSNGPGDNNKATKGKNKKSKNKQNKSQENREDNEKGIKRSRSQRSLIDVDRACKAQEPSKKQPSAKQSSPQSDDSSNVSSRRPTKFVQLEPSSDAVPSKKGGSKKDVPSPRRVTRSSAASSRSSASSPRTSLVDGSLDDTTLHTIIYDKGLEQEILNDSSELAECEHVSKSNVTIPETPDDSEVSNSDSEAEAEAPIEKGKK